jgi:hypothetical protein
MPKKKEPTWLPIKNPDPNNPAPFMLPMNRAARLAARRNGTARKMRDDQGVAGDVILVPRINPRRESKRLARWMKEQKKRA